MSNTRSEKAHAQPNTSPSAAIAARETSQFAELSFTPVPEYSGKQLKGFFGRSNAAQLRAIQRLADSRAEAMAAEAPVQRQAQGGGLPDGLRAGVESLSGVSMDGVKVHYNSSEPAKLSAHAYAQGSDIHVGPSQEQHLPHEAWHVAQQRSGRVQPNAVVNGQAVNDDPALEQEADMMGAQATAVQTKRFDALKPPAPGISAAQLMAVAQREGAEEAAVLTTSVAWELVKGVMWKEYSKGSLKTIIEPLLKAGDTFISFRITTLSGLASLVPGIQWLIVAAKAAVHAWDIVPDNVKTGILYVMGILSANAPILGRYKAMQDFIIKSDKGDVRKTVEGWVATAQSAINVFTQPLTSIYNYFMGGGKEETPAEVPAEMTAEEAGKLINLNLHVIKLMVNNLKLGNETVNKEDGSGKEEKGGLLVEFFIQLDLFNHKFPDRAGDGMDKLFFPFKGEFFYRAGSEIVLNAGDKTLLGNTLGRTTIMPLEVGKSGIKEAGLNVNKLIIGNGVIVVTAATGKLSGEKFSMGGNVALDIAGFAVSGTVNLALDGGHFDSLQLSKVNEEGNFKLKKFSIDKTYSGSLKAQMDTINLLDNTLSATDVNVSAEVANKQLDSFDFNLSTFKLDFWGGKLDVTNPHMSYKAKNERDQFANITGGADAVHGQFGEGVTIDLKALDFDRKAGKYDLGEGTISFRDFNIAVKKASFKDKGIDITEASLVMPEHGIEAKVTSLELNSKGADFKEISIALKKELSPIDQVKLKNSSITISKEEGFKLTLITDVSISPAGKEVLGAQGASLSLSKEEIAGSIGRLNFETNVFSVLIENAEFNKQRVGAEKASLTLGKKDEDSSYGSLMPDFDTGLLDFLNVGKSFEVDDAYFYKGQGFKIGGFSPKIDAFSIDLFGLKATVNPAERFIELKSSFRFPKAIPGIWPFSLEVPFPIVIGVSGVFGISLDGGVTLNFDAKAEREKGKNKPYKFRASPGVNGDMTLRIIAGAEFGNRLAIALQANLFAEAGVSFNTTATLQGGLLYGDNGFEKADPLEVLYDLQSKITAAVGGELRAKAFLFFDKKLVRVKFKDWTLGEWGKKGSLTDNKGSLDESKEPWKFAKDPEKPDMTEEILEGDEARKLLLDASTRIPGSGEERERILKELTMLVKGKADSLMVKHERLETDNRSQLDKLMKLILEKDAFFHENIEDRDINARLAEFDSKYKLEEIREHIRGNADRLDLYEAELDKVLGIMNNVEAQLQPQRLEEGVGTAKAEIDANKEETENLETKLTEVAPAKMDFEAAGSELQRMGAKSLTFQVSQAIMTEQKFIEISTTKGLLGGENERKRIKVVDAALAEYDGVRGGTAEVQKQKLEVLKALIDDYLTLSFSSRHTAVKLLKYEVEQALRKLKKKTL